MITKELPSPEDRGRVFWFSSDEEGGPDCGLSIGLGNGTSIYIGEMSKATLADHDIDLAKWPDGWWVVLYTGEETEIIGPVSDMESARSLIDALAVVLATNAPAKTVHHIHRATDTGSET